MKKLVVLVAGLLSVALFAQAEETQNTKENTFSMKVQIRPRAEYRNGVLFPRPKDAESTGFINNRALSIATLLAQHHPVTAVDVIPEKVETLNRKQSPIQDEYIEKYLKEKELNLTATLDGASAYRDADFIVIAAPTNYDPVKNYFDTHHIEDVIDLVLSVNPRAVMVIKSTIPVGYCRSLYLRYAQKGIERLNLLFSPEFLRESKALYDNLYPSRIIVGYPKLLSDE